MAIRAILIGTAALALVGCVSDPEAVQTAALAEDEVDPRRGDEVDRICFASNIDGFGETTRKTVVVREGRDRYLIETFGGCNPSLDHALSLAFDTFSSCVTRGDDIIAFDSLSGRSHRGIGPNSCKIKRIYAWDPDAKAEAETEENEETEETAVET
ncbi:MAG: DUF6491 family protein [Pseudomonadota bacterium]